MPGFLRWPVWFARITGLLIALLGLGVLLGWSFDIELLRSLVPGLVAMRPNAALCFLLCGAALMLRTFERVDTTGGSANRRSVLAGHLASFFAIVSALIGLLTLSQYAFGWDLRIDQLLIEPAADTPTLAPVRMAPPSAFAFFIIGCALLLAADRRSFWLFQVLALLGVLMGCVGFSRYVYGGAPTLPFVPFALHASAAFAALSVGVLCLRTDRGLVALLVSESAGGVIARRLVPAALFFPFAFAWLQLAGQRLGWFGAEAGFSLFALANVLVFGGLVWATAALLDRIDRERAGAERVSRESHRLLQAFADNLTAILWVKDLEGRYLIINGGYEALFDLRREDIVGRNDYEIFPQQQADIFSAVDKRALAAGKAIQAEETVARGASSVTFLSVKFPLLDENGKPYALCGISTDISERKRSEQALAAERTLLRTLIDALPDLVFTKDTAGRFTMCNLAELRHLGFERDEELIGKSVFNLYPRHLADIYHADDMQALSGQPIFGREEPVTDARGREYWNLTTKVPLRARNGEVVGLVGISRDISNIRLVQENLRQSQQHYQTLAESLPQLVWTCAPDGRCDYLSRQWVEYTGRPEREQLGYGWAEHVHPDDMDALRIAWEAATASGDHFDAEFRIRRADGAYRWFKTRAVPLHDADGRIVKWFGSNTDFESYKQADQRLKTQLERLNLLDRVTRAIGERQDLPSIFQAAIHSLEVELPVDFACVLLYDELENSLVVTSVGVRSAPLAIDLALTEQSRIEIDANGLSRCVRGELVHEPDIRAVGFPFPQRLARGGLGALVAAPLASESRVLGVLAVARRAAHSFSSADCEFIRQLTAHLALAGRQAQLHHALQRAYDDLRQSQQAVMQQERLRALGQMASGIAHDINNAISPVALYAENLLEHERHLSERGRSMLGTIVRAVDDVAATVARMREFYRQREPAFKLLPVRLNQLVRDVVDLTRARWSDMPQQRGAVIRLATELADDLPLVLGIESELREALTNLVFNAVDAMPEGGALTLRTRVCPSTSDDDPRNRVALEVEDTGVGMDEATRQRCLEPFFTTKGERGTGLGLAMVYGAAQRHNADIEIDSTPGRGTTFRFVLGAADPLDAAMPAATAGAKPARSLSLLVVDDDPLLLHSLAETLGRDGHVVTVASGGQAGVETFDAARIAGRPFDVVLTDLGMPYVDGRQVAREIKSRAPLTPVIMLTGWGQPLATTFEAPAHVDRVLGKPPKIGDLRNALALVTQPRATTVPEPGTTVA